MTDLEITKLCAEAIGLKYTVLPALQGSECFDIESIIFHDGPYPVAYEPLMNDAQCFVLMNKMKLSIDAPSMDGLWHVTDYDNGVFTDNESLNRAICECVAKMQLPK